MWFLFPVLGSKMLQPDLATFGGVYTISFLSASGLLLNITVILTVQGDSIVAALVFHLVQAELVGHVRHLISLIRRLLNELHWLFLVRVWEGESRLGQAALEDLHETVGVAVVMDGRPLSRSPYKNELCRGYMLSQLESVTRTQSKLLLEW